MFVLGRFLRIAAFQKALREGCTGSFCKACSPSQVLTDIRMTVPQDEIKHLNPSGGTGEKEKTQDRWGERASFPSTLTVIPSEGRTLFSKG